MAYVTCCKAERDGLPETETETETKMLNQTMTNLTEANMSETVETLRKIAREYGVSYRNVNKAELAGDLAQFQYAELENGHSDEGHDVEPDANCPICEEDGLLNDEPKATKAQATRRGGRTLIPGYTMNEAREAVASTLAESIAKDAKKAKGLDTLEAVESLLMDAASDDKATGVTAEYGRVMGEYLRTDRQDRYGYLLTKLHQATGRVLEARGFDRKTGLVKEEQA